MNTSDWQNNKQTYKLLTREDKLMSLARLACQDGNLSELKKLLKDPSLESNQGFHSEQLSMAALSGHLEIVRFLLTDPSLTVRADLHFEGDAAFCLAVSGRHTEIARYLLSSPDLGQHADMHAQNDRAFLEALKVCKYEGSYEMVEFLIFELRMEKSSSIEAMLMDLQEMNEEIVDVVQDMFAKVQFNKSLHTSLPLATANNKKAKI